MFGANTVFILSVAHTVLCKQCRPWSDAAFCGVRSGSTLFATNSAGFWQSKKSEIPFPRRFLSCKSSFFVRLWVHMWRFYFYLFIYLFIFFFFFFFFFLLFFFFFFFFFFLVFWGFFCCCCSSSSSSSSLLIWVPRADSASWLWHYLGILWLRQVW